MFVAQFHDHVRCARANSQLVRIDRITTMFGIVYAVLRDVSASQMRSLGTHISSPLNLRKPLEMKPGGHASLCKSWNAMQLRDGSSLWQGRLRPRAAQHHLIDHVDALFDDVCSSSGDVDYSPGSTATSSTDSQETTTTFTKRRGVKTAPVPKPAVKKKHVKSVPVANPTMKHQPVKKELMALAQKKWNDLTMPGAMQGTNSAIGVARAADAKLGRTAAGRAARPAHMQGTCAVLQGTWRPAHMQGMRAAMQTGVTKTIAKPATCESNNERAKARIARLRTITSGQPLKINPVPATYTAMKEIEKKKDADIAAHTFKARLNKLINQLDGDEPLLSMCRVTVVSDSASPSRLPRYCTTNHVTHTTKHEFVQQGVVQQGPPIRPTALLHDQPFSPIGRRCSARGPDSNEHANRGAMLSADRRRLNEELSSVRRRLCDELGLAMGEELSGSEFDERTGAQFTYWKGPSGQVYQLPPPVV